MSESGNIKGSKPPSFQLISIMQICKNSKCSVDPNKLLTKPLTKMGISDRSTRQP